GSPWVSVTRTRRSPSKPTRSRPRRESSSLRSIAMAITAAALLLAGGVAAFRSLRASGPAPPALADLGPLAPEIADIVRQARESVAEDPRDGARWGRFGLVCEANGLTGAARTAYANAAALEPAEPKWRFHLAAVGTRLGLADYAVGGIRRGRVVNPGGA